MLKRYHAAVLPAMHALAHTGVSDADKARLRDLLADADPALLLASVRATQTELGKRVDTRGMRLGRGDAPAPIDLAQFTASLQVTWSEGEKRPTHKRRYVRVRPVVRTPMLDAVRDQLLALLEAPPALSAVDVLQRPRGLHPDRFTADHPRTVQRFMKGRRAAMAREVLLGPLSSTVGCGSKAVTQIGTELNVTGDTEIFSNIPS